MTLIALINPHSEAVFLADCLLSSQAGNANYVLPSCSTKHAALKTSRDFRVHGLAQKIVAINRSVLVAWAGEVEPAMNVLKQLRIVLGEEHSDPDQVTFAMAILNSDELSRISLIVSCRDKNGRIHSVHHRCEVWRDSPCGEIWVEAQERNTFANA